jgi:DNA topoisomerase-1
LIALKRSRDGADGTGQGNRVLLHGIAFGPFRRGESCPKMSRRRPAAPRGLVYHPDREPGFSRQRRGKRFSYRDAEGRLIRDPDERARIAAIAIPPAWEDVWISPHANGHLQATGRDARGRKQYRYHPDWAAHRARRKVGQLPSFGRALPRLRSHIAGLLGAKAGTPELALGTVLALIDRTAIRVGSPEHVRENRSYGATTLRRAHLRIAEGYARLSFAAKGGQRVRRELRGARLMRALAKVHDLPGAELATWIDDDGATHAVRSEQVNAAIAAICGEGHTAKTFRTWAGTHAAFAVALRAARTGAPLTLRDMAEAAAERLSNTPAVAKASYIHPAVLDLARMGSEERAKRLLDLTPATLSGLRAGEGELIGFLESLPKS